MGGITKAVQSSSRIVQKYNSVFFDYEKRPVDLFFFYANKYGSSYEVMVECKKRRNHGLQFI